MPIPSGITRDDVLDALRELDNVDIHDFGFGDSTKYDLVHNDKRYPPKAVIGFAARRVRGGEILPNSEFNGGDTPGSANSYLRDLGFTLVRKTRGEEGDSASADHAYVGATLDSLVEEWSARYDDSFAHPEAWVSNREAVLNALSHLSATADLAAFAEALTRLPNPPPWTKRGAHRSFLGGLADRAPGAEAAQVVANAFSAPTSSSDAAEKLELLGDLADATDRLYPGRGFVPLAASLMWCFQDPEQWPWLSLNAEATLRELRLLLSTNAPDVRYENYRRLIFLTDAPPVTAAYALAEIHESGARSLSHGVYRRLAENADLLVRWHETNSYPNPRDARLAERNINAALGEFDLLARGIADEVGEQLVRDLIVSKTNTRIGLSKDRPFRADAYAVFTSERDMSLPAIRVWATRSGLAIGAHFGMTTHGASAEMARELAAEGLPNGIEFIEVREHMTGDRLAPAGDNPPAGELFVGKWFPGGITGTEVRDRTVATAATLQPVFDAMMAQAQGAAAPAPAKDDPLRSLVAEFRQVSNYPTDTDEEAKAERALMAEVISEDGLLGFDLREFRRIYNTSRYGSPGPQSILNTSLSRMSPEELDVFANNLEYLLRAKDPLEERINALMDQTNKGVKGFGEAVITKLLAIEYPAEILPIYVYRGQKGKARMLRLLGLHEEGIDSLDVGSRLVRSNDLLVERLRPFFGDDTYGMARFLYWLSEREEPRGETEEVDRIGNLAAEIHLDRAFLDEVVDLLRQKGQVIFYGPPGTGKTYVARKLARAIAPDRSQRMLVQFHPSTSYEDFFEGFRPETDAEGRLTYRLVKGPLNLIADRARENASKQFVLVIDEINRANLPKVFGELLFLLEYREESIRSLYRPDEPFELPKNLWLIGTMNTADRSIALVDAAMRRRFHFVPFFPDKGPMADLLRTWLSDHDEPGWVADLLDMVNDELRERLGGPDLQIGPTYFMRDGISADQRLRQVWTYSVFPFIEEQLYGDQAGIKDYEFDRVMRRFQAKTAPVDELEESGGGDSPTSGVE